MAKEIYDLKLEDIAPENINSDETVKAIFAALNPEGILISDSISEALILSRIDYLSEDILDLLAFQFHVDFYDLAATLDMKREAVKGSVIWHMKKGTEWAILKALSMIGIEGEFLHWKDTGDEPYTFRIKAKITGDFYRTQGRDKIIESIRRAVMESKSARSYFKGLDTSIEFHDDMNIYAGLFDALTGFQIISLARIPAPDDSRLYAGIASGLQGEERINLAHESDRKHDIYAGSVSVLNLNHEIGLEEEVMQELLLRFEQRIFDRLDEIDSRVMNEIRMHQSEVNSKLEEILDILRWKGPDDPLE